MKEIIRVFENQKYRRIVLFSFIICSLFAGAVCFEVYFSYHAELDRASIQSKNLTHVLEEQFKATLKKMDLIMIDLVRTMSNEKLSKEEIRELLAFRIKDIPEAKTFFLVDKDGYDIYRMKDGKRMYFGDRDYFLDQKNSAKDEFFISRPLVGRFTNMPSLAFSRKLTDKKGKFKGIIAAAIPISYFSSLYSKLDIGKEGSILLGSNENKLYARFPWDDSYLNTKVVSDDLISKIFYQNNVTEAQNSLTDGILRDTSARRVGDTKLFVSVGISREETLSSWSKRTTFYLIGLFTMIVGGSWYMFNFLKSLQELDERRKSAVHTAKLTSLGEMASGIAHEINNPLAVISSRCNQLKKQIERNQYDPEAFLTSLQRINQTVDRIAKIIRGLKSFSRNPETETFSKVSLKTIVDNTLELCTEKFRHQMVILKVEPVPEIILECQESQMVHVLLNLLSNAYDAVETLDERWVHLSFTINYHKSQLSIVVTDSGKGIPDKIAQNVMHPFFTTKDIGKGTGLGLSISRGIVEEHKGKIYLNRRAENTSFVIEIPVELSVFQSDKLNKIS